MSTTTPLRSPSPAPRSDGPADTATAGLRLRRTVARRWPTAICVAATVASLALVTPLPDTVQTVASAWGILTAAVIYLT